LFEKEIDFTQHYPSSGLTPIDIKSIWNKISFYLNTIAGIVCRRLYKTAQYRKPIGVRPFLEWRISTIACSFWRGLLNLGPTQHFKAEHSDFHYDSGFQPFLYQDLLQQLTITQRHPSETLINKCNGAMYIKYLLATPQKWFAAPGWKPLQYGQTGLQDLYLVIGCCF